MRITNQQIQVKKQKSDYASSSTETKSNNRKFSKNASLSHNKSKTSTGTSYVDKVFNKTGIKYTTWRMEEASSSAIPMNEQLVCPAEHVARIAQHFKTRIDKFGSCVLAAWSCSKLSSFCRQLRRRNYFRWRTKRTRWRPTRTRSNLHPVEKRRELQSTPICVDLHGKDDDCSYVDCVSIMDSLCCCCNGSLTCTFGDCEPLRNNLTLGRFLRLHQVYRQHKWTQILLKKPRMARKKR